MLKTKSVNLIKRYNLVDRVRELHNQDVSLRDIAKTLTMESGHEIRKDTVHRFIRSDIETKNMYLEKKAELGVELVKTELSTLEYRKTIIEGLIDIAVSGTNEHARVLAYKVANDAADSLDKRLGNISPTNTGVVVNHVSNSMDLRHTPVEEIARMAMDARNARLSRS